MSCVRFETPGLGGGRFCDFLVVFFFVFYTQCTQKKKKIKSHTHTHTHAHAAHDTLRLQLSTERKERLALASQLSLEERNRLKVSSLEAALAELRAQLSVADAENVSLRESVLKEGGMVVLEETVRRVRKEKERDSLAMEFRLDELRETTERLEAQLTTVGAERDALRARVDADAAELDRARGACAEAHAECALLRDRIALLAEASGLRKDRIAVILAEIPGRSGREPLASAKSDNPLASDMSDNPLASAKHATVADPATAATACRDPAHHALAADAAKLQKMLRTQQQLVRAREDAWQLERQQLAETQRRASAEEAALRVRLREAHLAVQNAAVRDRATTTMLGSENTGSGGDTEAGDTAVMDLAAAQLGGRQALVLTVRSLDVAVPGSGDGRVFCAVAWYESPLVLTPVNGPVAEAGVRGFWFFGIRCLFLFLFCFFFSFSKLFIPKPHTHHPKLKTNII
jgi:hypothetical protein